jgi:DNA-binding LacI/PurR family transcriptional regulator
MGLDKAENRVNQLERKQPTMQDVARELGVTKATVSYALSGKGRVAPETRLTILETARRMGFHPNVHAQRLTHGGCRDTIALFSFSLDLGVSTRKLQLLQNLLTEQGYRAPIHVCGGRSLEDGAAQFAEMNNLRRQHPLGIVCNTQRLQPEAIEELERYLAEGGMVVCYDSPIKLGCDSVVFDREHNTYTSTRHLLELGHRAIGCPSFSNPGLERVAGYQRAMAEYSVPISPSWYFYEEMDDLTTSPEHKGALIARKFLSVTERPTAMSITGDMMAAAFIPELQRLGLRVPEDVSVVGHDNLPLATYVCAVPLTTVSQPLETIADKVIELIMDRLESKTPKAPRRIFVQGELIERQSTAPYIDKVKKRK